MILNNLLTFLGEVFTSIGWDYIFFIGLGFEVLLAVFFIIKSHFSYEMRMTKRLLKLNNWLNRNKFINANNLVEFNNIMKKMPKLMRYHWHQFMLNRDKDPSFYMSAYNLVEKPLKTSSYLSNIKVFIGSTIAFAGLFLFFGLAGLAGADMTFGNIAKAFFAPFVMAFVAIIFVMIMRTRQNQNLSALYQYHHYFCRFMDKAVTTMPEYVDFEVLFTRQEIQKGIPVLNEYLEKRARQEQEELEKARLYAMEHENFDFSETGIDGALVLERAMRETETYLNIRGRLLGEIQQLEEEIESLKRNYENTQKDYQRKMQVSKENVDRLRKQQEETTNRIENNYIKKQQADEIKKQEQLEKDNENATLRFNQEIESLTAEIDTRRKELEEKRKYVEEAMTAEYQTFSTKMYKSVYDIAEERNQADKDAIIAMKDEIADELDKANQIITEKDHEIEQLHKILAKNNIILAENGGFYSEKLKSETKKVKRGKKNKQDDEDDLVYVSPEELNGQVAETPASQDVAIEEAKPELQEAQAPQQQVVQEQPSEVQQQQIQEAQPHVEEQPQEVHPEEIDEGQFVVAEEPVLDEDYREYGDDGGWFDRDGYYRYENGAYFDTEGRYFDEFGGWYEADGITYHEPVQESHAEEPIQEEHREYGEDGGWFDEEGYYRYDNGTYFDPEGRYFDEFGGWYEADGVTYHEPIEYQEDDYYDDGIEEYLDPRADEEYREYGGDGGWFDRDGYYRYENGAYFDPEGRYFDEFGGWFEEDGVTYHPPEDHKMAKQARKNQPSEPVSEIFDDIQEEKAIDRIADQEFEDFFGPTEATTENPEEVNPEQPPFEVDENTTLIDENAFQEDQIIDESAFENAEDGDNSEADGGAELMPTEEPTIVEPIEQPAEQEEVEGPTVEPVKRVPLSDKAIAGIQSLKEQFALSEGLVLGEEELIEEEPTEAQSLEQEPAETKPAEEPVLEEVTQEQEIDSDFEEQPLAIAEEPENQPIAKPKKLGRPKKVKVDLSDLFGAKTEDKKPEETDKVVAEQPKKKAGRPKKVKVDLSDLVSEKPKAKRGRPKKSDNTEQNDKPAKAKTTAKSTKKAEKPAKSDNKKTSAKKSTAKKSTKKTDAKKTQAKRGRPRKNATLDDLKALNKKIEDENKKLAEHQQQLNKQLEESLIQLSKNSNDDK